MNFSSISLRSRLLLLLSLVLVASAGVHAQTSQPVESGKFRLHKFEQPIGEETCSVTRDGDSLVV